MPLLRARKTSAGILRLWLTVMAVAPGCTIATRGGGSVTFGSYPQPAPYSPVPRRPRPTAYAGDPAPMSADDARELDSVAPCDGRADTPPDPWEAGCELVLETTPPATVAVGPTIDQVWGESARVGTTPCRLALPEGDHAILLEAGPKARPLLVAVKKGACQLGMRRSLIAALPDDLPKTETDLLLVPLSWVGVFAAGPPTLVASAIGVTDRDSGALAIAALGSALMALPIYSLWVHRHAPEATVTQDRLYTP